MFWDDFLLMVMKATYSNLLLWLKLYPYAQQSLVISESENKQKQQISVKLEEIPPPNAKRSHL